MITLYTTALSANGRKPLVVGRLLGLEMDVREVNVYAGEGRSEEYLAINPAGKIPTLIDGDLVLTESNAQILFLSEAYGENRYGSSDPVMRAEILRWLFWESSQWQPGFVATLSEPIGRYLQTWSQDPSPGSADWSAEPLPALLSQLEAHLEGRQWLVGDSLSLADVSVGGMMMYVRCCGFPWQSYPSITRWYEGLEATEAWRATAVGPWSYD